MKIVILGAAGQVAQKVIKALLNQTDAQLVLYARDASTRLQTTDPRREQLVDGDFENIAQLEKALNGADWVFIDSVEDKKGMQTIVRTMNATGVKQLIVATSLGIYGEVPGKFGEWNQQMLGDVTLNQMAETLPFSKTPVSTTLSCAWPGCMTRKGTPNTSLLSVTNPSKAHKLPAKPLHNSF